MDLRALDLTELEDLVVSLGEKKFRAKQVFQWIHKGVRSLEEMRNLPKAFLEELGRAASIEVPGILAHQVSSDGTEKFLFAFRKGDGSRFDIFAQSEPASQSDHDRSETQEPEKATCESVLMRYKYGNTVCVSTQAGCRMGCAFCASGLNGLVRDLTAGEIVSQILEIENETGERVSRVVFMGTGEPFDNYENVSKAIRLLHDGEGRGMSMRNITVSTCGLVPKITEFGKDFPEANLAISLHQPDGEKRKEIMPVAKKYGMTALMKACDEYVAMTNRRVSYEYALIKGENDSDDDLKKLAGLLRGRLSHVNLIPLNEVSETGLSSAGRSRALEWKDYLDSHGVPATVRRQLGSDIDGACGQLRNRES